MLKMRSERDRADLPLLTVARERGVFVRSADDDNHNVIPEDLSSYKVARQGDLVINKMKAWQGSLGLAPVDGIVSPAYFVFEADFEVPKFGEYLLRSKPYVAAFAAASDGVRIGQWDLNIPRMRNIPVALPPVEEQAAIVKYLAHANARIDKAIAAKRRLSILLKEQRNAVLDERLHVRGRGWPIRRLKTLLRGIDQGVSPQADNQVPSAGEWGVLKAGCVNYGGFRADQVKRLPPEFQVPLEHAVEAGDVLVSRASGSPDLVGSAARVPADPPQAILSDKIFRLRLNDEVDPDFLVLLMNARDYREQVRTAISGAEGLANNLPVSSLRTFTFKIPPLAEQIEIVRAIEAESAAVLKTARRLEQEINLLHEFRTRLVADVVTGQVDVREIATSLPEVESGDLTAGDLDDVAVDDVMEMSGV